VRVQLVQRQVLVDVRSEILVFGSTAAALLHYRRRFGPLRFFMPTWWDILQIHQRESKQ